MTSLFRIALLVLCLPVTARAQALADLHVDRTAQPPRIDGVLDDEVWQRAPMAIPAGDWRSYNPVRGDRMSDDFRTDVRVAYDDRNIYFAFHCFDQEPDRIRTTVSRRDAAFNDDWIAISLDSAGTGQSAYHLFSNPSASQMDALNTSASGEQFDADMVWFSAAKTTTTGYIVEVQIPLQTLRFAGGDQVRMGLVFFRKISRMGYSYAWPEMLPGQWVFDRPAHLVFNNLQPRRLVELLPSATYGVQQARGADSRWSAADSEPNVGISGKLGITSGITLDGTINPDFSQVESDAFQVQVNQRFPVFFSEKRPFFMEGMGLFNMAGTGGDSNMRTAVHTRRIINPMWGYKVTGTAGQATFGVLNAADETPDLGGPRDRFTDRNRMFAIGRATYALRRSDYVGAIVTDTRHEGRHNQVVGGDLSIRLSPTQSVSATALASRTMFRRDPESLALTVPDASGNAGQVTYGYETRRINFSTQVEHYGRGFEMDTAFYNRTGFTGAWSYGEINFYPKSTWLQRVHPFYFAQGGHDDVQDGSERLLNTGVRFNFTRQGFLSVSHIRGHETFRGQRFRIGSTININGNAQVLRWLSFNASGRGGPSIYYDEQNPFAGRVRSLSGGVTLQPNEHLRQQIDYNRVRFARESTGLQVYGVDIVNSKTTYQFDKHFLVRFLAQFDSSSKQVLTDLLASYEFVPGTVLHAGYGSLYERNDVFTRAQAPAGVVPVDPGTNYLMVNRGLFFKASYLKRF